MHRLFVAFVPPEEMIDCLVEVMDGEPEGLRWISEEQLHCTLRFIGEVERPVAEDLAHALADVRAPAMQCRLDGVGAFDRGRRGALWARMAPREPIEALHHKIDRIVTACGLPPERRAFLPHVTLARWSGRAVEHRGWSERHGGLSSPAMTVGRFTLFESDLTRAGPIYREVAHYPLDA